MCGIVGYVGGGNPLGAVIAGLKRLEYRGYDSAGVAVVRDTLVRDAVARDAELEIVRSVGRVSELEAKLASAGLLAPAAGSASGKSAYAGSAAALGHTRWATHGRPTEANAHPHTDPSRRVAVVHNGIIENYTALKAEMRARGNTFTSETDTEVIAHLVAYYLAEQGPDAKGSVEGLVRAVEQTTSRLDGSFALGVVAAGYPGTIVAARRSSPLVVATAGGAGLLASDVTPLVAFTKEVIYLEDGQVAVLGPGHVSIRQDGLPYSPRVTAVAWDTDAAERGGFPHFMLKEIYEQPITLHRLASELVTEGGSAGETGTDDDDGTPPIFALGRAGSDKDSAAKVNRVVLVAQGTAFHAAMVGRNLIERAARIPAEAELASDFRYRDPIIDKTVLVIAVSQSGETADTLGAVRVSKEAGCRVIGVINVVGSTIARECDGVIYTRCGPEIGVASTKAFTGMIAALYVAAIDLGVARGALSAAEARRRVSDLVGTPQRVEALLAGADSVKRVALKYKDAKNFLFLGRGTGWPLAMEGALKLKEVSYIHAEGYNAGEMKHGPIALIDENMPVLVIALKGRRYEKIIGNIQEVKARGGRVIAIASEDDERIGSLVDDVIRIRDDSGVMNSILCAVPLQLIAYYIAVALGRDVDNPRNLAKSVTVE